MKWVKNIKRKVFRKLIDIADTIDVWFRYRFNYSPKQKALEVSQDNIPLTKLDETIGKALNIKPIEK